jgi:two-component system response regulator NreC
LLAAAWSDPPSACETTEGAGVRQPASQERAIRIVLADGRDVVRSDLRMLLDSEHDLEVVAEANDLDSARRYVRGYGATVLVLDLDMPGEPCLQAIPSIRAEAPATQIVVLSIERTLARQALRAGALACVAREAADEWLAGAVRRAAEIQRA